MNAHELKRIELVHLEAVVTRLEVSRKDGSFRGGCFIYSCAYWRSRVLALCGSNTEADIARKTQTLLDRLAALA